MEDSETETASRATCESHVPDTAQQRDADRLQDRADDLKARADRQDIHASGMYGRFAGGQPLLHGHHSYRSAVRDRDRADNATRRAIATREAAKRAQQRANEAQARADIAAVETARGRPWQPGDFRPGDIVTVRAFHTSIDTYRVKRVNKKTLTLEGAGGGWDDPKREYDRVLSRTRDGVTITNPAQAEEAS